MSLTSAATTYAEGIQEILARALEGNSSAIEAGGRLLAQSFGRDGLAYVFGSGHSHIFAEEAFYRAGGAVRICPILKPAHMLHDGARHSTVLERRSGQAAAVLEGYELNGDRDVMIVVSNSGANPLPVEVAQAARDAGLPLIAITSVAYASASQAATTRLHQIADVVLDNHCPPGDALVTLDAALPRVGPGSSVVGLALLNTMIVEALAIQVRQGETPDVYLSAGMPGAAPHNDAVAETFAERIPHI